LDDHETFNTNFIIELNYKS